MKKSSLLLTLIRLRSFCDAIAHGDRVDLALQQGRRAIGLPLKDAIRRDSDPGGITKLSLGQWCLPMLFSHEPDRPLIDWNFIPKAPTAAPINQSLGDLSLPPRFIGRRLELRTLKSSLRKEQLGQRLLTGPGGQGKTALAGKEQEFNKCDIITLGFSSDLVDLKIKKPQA